MLFELILNFLNWDENLLLSSDDYYKHEVLSLGVLWGEENRYFADIIITLAARSMSGKTGADLSSVKTKIGIFPQRKMRRNRRLLYVQHIRSIGGLFIILLSV